MKKALLIFTSFLIGSIAFAQINRGQFLVGGNGTFTSSNNAGYKSSQLTLSPGAGYFFMDKLAGGLNVNFGRNRSKQAGVKSTSATYGISPFVRYYVLPATSKINLFGQASYTWGKSDNISNNIYTGKSTFNGYSISAGPTIFITRNIAVELTAGLTNNYHRSKSSYNNSTNKFKEKLFQIGVGFQIHLGNGKK
ncbi:MAG: outer membrane beta-barrel protein [Agriterribacter sp.]